MEQEQKNYSALRDYINDNIDPVLHTPSGKNLADNVLELIGEVEQLRARVDSTVTIEGENNPLRLIINERMRQIEEEGWTIDHDDQHIDQSLAMAAACYAAPEDIFVAPDTYYDFIDAWPWADEWDKRDLHSRMHQLAIAGALIAAEMERLQRVEANNG